jgi:hypothetical protein
MKMTFEQHLENRLSVLHTLFPTGKDVMRIKNAKQLKKD